MKTSTHKNFRRATELKLFILQISVNHRPFHGNKRQVDHTSTGHVTTLSTVSHERPLVSDNLEVKQ